ncbi:MAG: hypothetical protein MSH43_00860, partial [Bacteroidales bacterium]|nr:hypothetical protein [Bacteroidales bacterium]
VQRVQVQAALFNRAAVVQRVQVQAALFNQVAAVQRVQVQVQAAVHQGVPLREGNNGFLI